MAAPRPAFYPAPAGYAPAGYVPGAHPAIPQNFAGFPPGFNPARYVNPQMQATPQQMQPVPLMQPMQPMHPLQPMHPMQHMQMQATPQPTPETMTFALPPQGHPMWQAREPSESEESESESDSDDEPYLGEDMPPAFQQAYLMGWKARGRSQSRGRSHGRHRSDSPRETRRGRSVPPAAVHAPPMTPRHHNRPMHGTPFRQSQLLLTPVHAVTPLPGAPQQLPHGFFTAPTLAEIAGQAPHLYPGNMHPHPNLVQHPGIAHRRPEQPVVYPYHPQPGVVPGLKKTKRQWTRTKSQEPEQNLYGMLPDPQWGPEAARLAIIDPSRVSHKSLRRVSLHPLLAPGCCNLMTFNAIRQPAKLIAEGYSINQFYSDPATSPPMNQFTFVTGVHQQTVTIQNPHGVTVGDVITNIGGLMLGKLKRADWDRFSERRRMEITDWFHHNRIVGKMPPEEQGVRMADLLGANTMFSGMKATEGLDPTRVPPGTFVLQWGPPG